MASSPAPAGRTLSRRLLLPHGVGRAPLCGFIGYVHPHEPRLLRRIGWEIANDIHDDFADQTSDDNGATWSPLRPSLSKEPVEGGHLCHTENAILLLPDGRLVHFTNNKFEANLAGCNLDSNCQARISVGTPAEISRGAGEVLVSDFGLPQGLCFSFVNPILDARGRILAPVQWQKHDADGAIRRYAAAHQQRSDDLYIASACAQPRTDLPEVLMDVWEAGLLIGTPGADGRWSWRRTGPVPYDFALSSRGLMEPALAELPGGKLVMVLRGANFHWPDRPGYKWVTCSTDGGDTWTPVTPLACSDGTVLESGSSGSMLVRSARDGQLYWIGNLCTEGRRPHGNMPRSPLHIARVCEEPFALDRASIAVIDRAAADEHPDTQMSNFKYCQDRATGDLLLYLTRYGEKGYAELAWINANLYEYRIALG